MSMVPPSTPIKTFTVNSFKFEVFETLRSTLAYRFYCDDVEIYHNNDYNPSKEALENDQRMLSDLMWAIASERNVPMANMSKKEIEFVSSDKFKELCEMVDGMPK